MIIPALPTPFEPRGAPDWDALQALVEALEPDVDGFLFFGSTGESVHLSLPEKRAGLARVRTARPFLVGVVEESLAAAREAAQVAAAAGAQAILATPPRYYAGALGDEGQRRYFEGLAGAGGEVWLYHVPQLSRVALGLPVVRELAAHPQIAGIKDSSGTLGRVAYYASSRLPLRVFTGHAPTFLGALALGAEGGILGAANLAPRAYRALLDAYRAGDVAGARTLQERLEPFGRVLGQGGTVLVKQALRFLGLPAGSPRPPCPEASPHWAELRPHLEGLRAEGWLVA